MITCGALTLAPGLCESVAEACLCSQRIRATVNTLEQKRLLMDLDISMRTVDCFFTVTFYGALFREVKHSTALESVSQAGGSNVEFGD